MAIVSIMYIVDQVCMKKEDKNSDYHALHACSFLKICAVKITYSSGTSRNNAFTISVAPKRRNLMADAAISAMYTLHAPKEFCRIFVFMLRQSANLISTSTTTLKCHTNDQS